MMEKLLLSKPVVTEGKYDKIKLSSLLDTTIITTDGFGIFNDEEKRGFIKKHALNTGIFLLTDSDGGGLLIRNEIHSFIPPECITDLYIPQKEGREKRKKEPSKEGLLGVEGIDPETIRNIFSKFAVIIPEKNRKSEYSTNGFEVKNHSSTADPEKSEKIISRIDFYNSGFIGKDNSSERRKALCRALDLPQNISSSSLLSAINELSLQDKYLEFVEKPEGKD